jgi:hypothetical protein
MKIRLIALLAASLLLILALPSAAQPSTRAPVIVTATSINNASNAHPFHPDVQIFVTGVESATIEASEPDHTCAPGADTRSVWFVTELMPGTLTLDTTGSSYTIAGGTSPNTVISLYRLNNWTFSGFADISSIACNDNGGSAGIINAFNIPTAGQYMVQISAAPGVAVTGASQVNLLANFTAAIPISFDEPSGARTLKIPSLPAIVNIGNATVALDEPFDPSLGAPVTNTVWFKFTYSERRIFAVSNFYDSGGDLGFSLFQKSGSAYVPASGILSNGADSITAILNAGTYYLRVGLLGEPNGSTANITTFTVIAYLTDPNFDFSVGMTEGGVSATPDLTGWNVKNGTAGPGGDEVFCDGPPAYECGFRFTSIGATEATQIKAVIGLNTMKLKKGDLVIIQAMLLDLIGTPDLKVTMKLTNAAGATQNYNLNVVTASEFPAIITQVPATFTPVKSTIIVKNRDTTPGDSVEVDGVIAAVLRVGEGVVRGGTLKLPLGGGLSAAWAEAASAAPKGVLPVPPAAQ